MSVFHYVPLHCSKAGHKFGEFHGSDIFTSKESERLIRLPMYYGLKEKVVTRICRIVDSFFKKDRE